MPLARLTRAVAAAACLGAVLVLTACGGGGGGDGGGLSGRITADGSSTVGPYVSVAAERFRSEEPDVQITVGISGTGGGFERFCAGETDISNASRPIEDDEAAACTKKGIDYVEFHIANDALTVVVNKQNDWAGCLTVEQLKRIWEPGSKVEKWNQVAPQFPDVTLELYGPGTDSGTFDFFTKAIVGEEGASRSDYSPSENDNVVVQGVAGDKGALGYFGFSYYDQNKSKLNAVEIDGGGGCVTPSAETAQDGTYKPLARPLFVYAKTSSLERPEVEAFLRYIFDHEQEIADQALFVSLTPEQLESARKKLESALSR